MMKKNKNVWISVIIIVIVVLGATFLSAKMSANQTNDQIEVTEETGKQTLQNLMKNINIIMQEPQESEENLQVEMQEEELPDISKYPLAVEGKGEICLEIVSSKKTDENDWLINVAKKFNQQEYTIEGKKVSVSVRNMDSDLATKYILSETYVPDAFTPSSQLWGEILKQNQIPISMTTDRLAGNVCGIILSEEKYTELVQSYGTLNMNTVIAASEKQEIKLGYINPLGNDTGMNFLVSLLHTFDSSDLLSSSATEKFQEFQKNVSLVAYDIEQIKTAVQNRYN